MDARRRDKPGITLPSSSVFISSLDEFFAPKAGPKPAHPGVLLEHSPILQRHLPPAHTSITARQSQSLADIFQNHPQFSRQQQQRQQQQQELKQQKQNGAGNVPSRGAPTSLADLLQRPNTADASMVSNGAPAQAQEQMQRPSTGTTTLPIHQVMSPSKPLSQTLTIEQQVTRRHAAVICLQRFWRRRRLVVLCTYLARQKRVLMRFAGYARRTARRRRLVRLVVWRFDSYYELTVVYSSIGKI